MKPLYKRYENEEPAGVYSMGYCGYLFFEPIDEDRYTCDYVVCYEYSNGNDPKGFTRADYRRHNVTCGEYGARRPHIWRDHSRIYLENVMYTF